MFSISRRACPRGAALLAACVAFGAAAGSASAATQTLTYGATSMVRTLTVPPGVTHIDVVAVGGRGGSGGGSAPVVGAGARVSGTLAVTPGQKLYVLVGGNGRDTGCFNGGGAGGFNGGAGSDPSNCGAAGGGGGGASDVRVCDPSAPCVGTVDPLGRLLVAAGGGGAGYFANGVSGIGGDAGVAGGDADVSDGSRGPAGGGGPGTETAGGVGGANADIGAPWPPTVAGTGVLGAGGAGSASTIGALAGGGGGGGGRYGGGGGGSANYYAGGGGGGSNLVPVSGTETVDATGTPLIRLTFDVGPPAAVARPTLGEDRLLAGGHATTTVTTTVTDGNGVPLIGQTVTFTSTGASPAIGTVTDNGDGTYSAPVTVSATAGTAAIRARVAAGSLESAPVDLVQIARPVVVSPVDGAPFLDGPGGPPRIAVSGTADASTTSVDVGCVNGDGFEVLDGAIGVPVVGGRWTAASVLLPETISDALCRLVALPAGTPGAAALGAAGPRLRRLAYEAWGDSLPTRVDAFLGGTDVAAEVAGLGVDDCGVRLRRVDDTPDTPGPSLACVGGIAGVSDAADQRATLLVDGHRTYTPTQVVDSWQLPSGLRFDAHAPTLTATPSTADDGSLVLTERDATARCTGTDAIPDDTDACGGLAGTGIAVTTRTVVSPSGRHVERTLAFESTDGRAHDVRLSIDQAVGFDEPEFRFDGESGYAPRESGASVPGTAGPSTVLVREAGADPAGPALAVTAATGVAEQAFAHEDELVQRFTRSVPATGTSRIGIAFDVVDGDPSAAGSASRAAYGPAVAIDAVPAETGAATVTLTGTARVWTGRVALRVAGEDVAVRGDGTWSKQVALADGSNVVEAVVTNEEGVSRTASVRIARTPTQAPPTPTTPTTPTTPKPAPPVKKPVIAALLSAPKTITLAKAPKHGVVVKIRVGVAGSKVTARLRGKAGTLATVTKTKVKAGTLTVRLKPSKQAARKAAKALRAKKRGTVTLTVVVRTPAGETKTLTKKLVLRR